MKRKDRINLRIVWRLLRRGNAFFFVGISILGFFSLITMHLAGFMYPIPSDLWPFIDTAFMASFSSRFTVLIAFSLLVGRLTPYLLEYIFSFTEGWFAVAYLSFQPKWRRLFRLRGHISTPERDAFMRVVTKNNSEVIKLVSWFDKL